MAMARVVGGGPPAAARQLAGAAEQRARQAQPPPAVECCSTSGRSRGPAARLRAAAAARRAAPLCAGAEQGRSRRPLPSAPRSVVVRADAEGFTSGGSAPQGEAPSSSGVGCHLAAATAVPFPPPPVPTLPAVQPSRPSPAARGPPALPVHVHLGSSDVPAGVAVQGGLHYVVLRQPRNPEDAEGLVKSAAARGLRSLTQGDIRAAAAQGKKIMDLVRERPAQGCVVVSRDMKVRLDVCKSARYFTADSLALDDVANLLYMLPSRPKRDRPVLYITKDDHHWVQDLKNLLRGRVVLVPCEISRTVASPAKGPEPEQPLNDLTSDGMLPDEEQERWTQAQWKTIKRVVQDRMSKIKVATATQGWASPSAP